MLTPKVLEDKYAESIYNLFQEKNWTVETDSTQLNTFDRFCQRMAELESDDDRDFMLDLSRDYLWVRMEDYERLLVKVFRKWFGAIDIKFTNERMLYICPMLPPCDFCVTKSSKFMLYLCQTVLLRQLPEFHENRIRLFDNPGLLKSQLENMQCLVLIDDYIGSGETGIGCLEYIRSIGVDLEKVYILSLVAQKKGIDALQENGVRVFSEIVCQRGISDKYPIEQVDYCLNKMREIGKTIKAKSGMRLGYGETEALVTMIKTPNNTFPFYWFEKDINSRAPFPRRGNVMMVSEEKHDEEYSGSDDS